MSWVRTLLHGGNVGSTDVMFPKGLSMQLGLVFPQSKV